MFDELEPRRLFAVAIEYDTATGVLRFFGDDRPNTINFALTSRRTDETLRFVVDGREHAFSDPITRISMSMGDGADTVVLGRTAIPTFVRGGPGADTLSGGDANDTLLGEGGFDYVFGRYGDDLLDGGLQGDTILGHAGNDTILAGSGLLENDDTISGGAGNDLLDYAQANRGLVLLVGDLTIDPDLASDYVHADVETIRGTLGDDFIQNGHANPMQIEGLAGNDTLRGGPGRDTLVGGEGENQLAGMGGQDVFVGVDDARDTVLGGGDQNRVPSLKELLDLLTLD